MTAFLDLTGETFGRWTVVARARNNGHGSARFRCRCACGQVRVVPSINLRNGVSLSCGCLRRDAIRQANTTHGERESPEYQSWQSAKRRCFNPRDEAYLNYGGRGITMCEEWKNSFAAFLRDMGRRPSLRHTLDRFPNNDGHYEPGNCRWATKSQQALNRRSRSLTRGELYGKSV